VSRGIIIYCFDLIFSDVFKTSRDHSRSLFYYKKIFNRPVIFSEWHRAVPAGSVIDQAATGRWRSRLRARRRQRMAGDAPPHYGGYHLQGMLGRYSLPDPRFGTCVAFTCRMAQPRPPVCAAYPFCAPPTSWTAGGRRQDKGGIDHRAGMAPGWGTKPKEFRIVVRNSNARRESASLIVRRLVLLQCP
jgi:hypothetical protein